MSMPTVPCLGNSGTFTTSGYSAISPFVWRKISLEIPYNLSRGSAVRNGELRDGSSIGESPVIMPWEDSAVYDATAHLRTIFRENPSLELKALNLCSVHNLSLESVLTKGPGPVIWIDNSVHFSNYGDRQTYPLLKAIFAQQSFAIIQDRKGLARVNGKFDRNFFERLLELEAFSRSSIVVPEGLLVPTPHRLFISIILMVVAIVCTALTIKYDNRESFIERIESATFVMGVILLTFPAVVSLFSAEPNLVRNAVRGKCILTKQSQVTKYFKLSRRDYAMLATRIKGSKLVSRDVGCYLTGEERGTHHGDEPVVQCEDLAPFGVICGQSVHYRTNWQTVCISNRLGDNQTHLTTEIPRVRYWCAGVRENTWVGFASLNKTGS